MIRRNAVLAVCTRGHVLGEVQVQPKNDELGFCPRCGGELLWRCAHCRQPIEGRVEEFGFASSFAPRLELAGDFCGRCGQPFPWASRKSIANHIENSIKHQTNLPPADRRMLVEQLKSLRSEPTSREVEQAQLKALKMLKAVAPVAWTHAQPLIESLATGFIKTKLGLP